MGPPQHQIPHITLAKPISGRGPGLERAIAAPGKTDGHTSYGPACLWRLEAEDDRITPTEPGRRHAQGGRSYLEDRGALLAQPCHGGWGRLGERERIVNYCGL